MPAGRFTGACTPDRAAAIAGHLQQVLQLRGQPQAAVIQQLGRNCHMPNACQTPIHGLLHAEWRLAQQQQQPRQELPASEKQQLFASAVCDALAGGGCCASRACFLGACLGAWLGPDAVPPAWQQKCSSWQSIAQQTTQLLMNRDAASRQ